MCLFIYIYTYLCVCVHTFSCVYPCSWGYFSIISGQCFWRSEAGFYGFLPCIQPHGMIAGRASHAHLRLSGGLPPWCMYPVKYQWSPNKPGRIANYKSKQEYVQWFKWRLAIRQLSPVRNVLYLSKSTIFFGVDPLETLQEIPEIPLNRGGNMVERWNISWISPQWILGKSYRRKRATCHVEETAQAGGSHAAAIGTYIYIYTYI